MDNVEALTVKKFIISMLIIIIATVFILLVCVLIGPQIGISDSLKTLLNPHESHISSYQTVVNFRLPRVLLAAIVGAALSVAGVAFQAILRNPLAEPYILGISSGGALGAVIAVFTGVTVSFSGFSAISVFSFTGCILTTLIVYLLASGHGHHIRYNLILTGVIVGAFLSAFVLLLTAVVRHNDLHRIVYWLMGNFNTPLEDFSLGFITVYIIVGFLLIFSLSRSFNVLMLGDESAASLGCNP
ncbi:MAG: iron ABC transporter permease, partial [Planctomycetota bacterium]